MSPVGGAVSACCKMDSEASESTKNLKLLCISWRKIKFFVGRKDIAVMDADTVAGGGRQV